MALIDRIHLSESGDVAIEELDLRLHAQCDHCGIHARHTSAKNDDLGSVDTGHAPHENAPPSVGPHERMRSDLRGQSSSDL